MAPNFNFAMTFPFRNSSYKFSRYASIRSSQYFFRNLLIIFLCFFADHYSRIVSYFSGDPSDIFTEIFFPKLLKVEFFQDCFQLFIKEWLPYKPKICKDSFRNMYLQTLLQTNSSVILSVISPEILIKSLPEVSPGIYSGIPL